MSGSKFSGTVQERDKPIYLLVADDCTVKEGVVFYVSKDLTDASSFIEFRGQLITKANAAKLTKDPYAEIKDAKDVNKRLPWHKIIRIDNLNYKIPKPQ